MQSEQSAINGLLKKAIQREIESQHLYKNLSYKVANPESGYALTLLFHQEETHQQILEKFLSGDLGEAPLNENDIADYHIAEHLDQPEISLDMNLPDIFLLAANREKKAHDFYMRLAGIYPNGDARTFLEKLAHEELSHKQKVEQLYTEVAFPQTDGG